jgi:hypothetical protein
MREWEKVARWLYDWRFGGCTDAQWEGRIRASMLDPTNELLALVGDAEPVGEITIRELEPDTLPEQVETWYDVEIPLGTHKLYLHAQLATTQPSDPVSGADEHVEPGELEKSLGRIFASVYPHLTVRSPVMQLARIENDIRWYRENKTPYGAPTQQERDHD